MRCLQRLAITALSLLGLANASSVVQTDSGLVEGYQTDQVDVWRGIPFAQPPTGNNRFRRPQPVTPWEGTKQTILPPNICPQVRLTDFLYLGNEDCLYLSVYAPSDREDPLPVFVWFFGGGYVFGDGWEFGFYDGINLAKARDMIIVGVNYRLGPLGFLALDELTNEDEKKLSGNMALHDQRAALEWVQRNIAQFGGDKNRVTIAGESAGAFSVCWHLAAPKSAGLFHNAILESGTCEAQEFFLTADKSKSWSRGYAAMVGCDPATLKSEDLLPCLRALPTGKVMGHLLGSTENANTFQNLTGTLTYGTKYTITSQQQAWIESMHTLKTKVSPDTYIPLLYPVMSWGTTIDGQDEGLPDLPLRRIQSGNYSRVPVIMGTNQDEGDIFVPLLHFVIKDLHIPLVQSDLTLAFNHFFNNNATIVSRILEEYPLYDYDNSASKAAAMVLRDFFFVCSSRQATLSMFEAGSEAYLYHFTYPGDFIESPFLGDYHSAELPFVFNNPWPPLLHIFSQRDQTMADTFGQYWSNLAHFGNPNGNGINPPSVNWPSHNSSTFQNLILDVPVKIETDYIRSKCEFWNQINSLAPWN